MNLKTHNLPICIEWDKFTVGTSIFVPTLEPKRLLKELLATCKSLHIRARGKRVLEKGMMGVRIWRLR